MKQPIHMPARRSNNRELLKALKPFAPSMNHEGDTEGTCGNIARTSGLLEGGKSLYELVSSPMLLSRLCAGFEGLTIRAHGQEAYKVTWSVALVHTSSGNVVTFYDWKGAASIGSNVLSAEGQFFCDLRALLLALSDDAFPHPYDGCRVGEIA